MQKIKAKLNSKRGVSIVMALLLALVCLFAGAAALTAASANIGRYSYLRDDQQEYLSISSAARLLSEQFKQGSNNISADYSAANREVNLDGLPADGHVYKLLKDWMSKLLWHCYNKSLSDGGDPSASLPDAVNFTVTVEDSSSQPDANFKPVNVKVTTPKSPEISGTNTQTEDIEVELSTGDDNKRILEFTVRLTLTVDTDSKTINVTTIKVEDITLPGK